MLILSRVEEIESYRTKDESEIRELMHPEVHGNAHQSLALASVPPGRSTVLHMHVKTEELYHFVRGTGSMSMGRRTIRGGKR